MEDIDTYFQVTPDPGLLTLSQGNLCRCTGYRPILDSLRPFTDSWAANSVPQVKLDNF